jgi:hypothetical protein
MLQYFPADNNDAGRRWLLKPFNEDVIVAAELEVKIYDKLITLSVGKIFRYLDLF